MERWREALLWTYVVANLGGTEGVWGHSARRAIKDFFDLRDDEVDVDGIEVQRGERWTTNRMRIDKTFDQMGWHSPMRVKYLFCEHPHGRADISVPRRPHAAHLGARAGSQRQRQVGDKVTKKQPC